MLKKLAKGELSLRSTFWVFGLLGFFIFFILASITHAGVLRSICPYGQICSRNLIFFILSNFITLLMRGAQSGVLIYLLCHLLLSACYMLYMYITLCGLWKSAKSYEGAKFWAWSAKVVLVCLAFVSLKSIF